MKHNAFSLVELSIVLVILGLLTGGILTGQSLIDAAELRAITEERNQLETALNVFRGKYFALPGDMNNATDFWTEAATCPGTHSDGTDDRSTCDGDNNGMICELGNSSCTYEIYLVFKHLSNAGLVTGNYSGVTGSGSTAHSVIGENVMASGYSGGGWTLRDYGDYGGDGETYSAASIGNYNHIWDYGAQHPSNTSREELLKPEDVWNIDTKIDDGRPARGNVILRHLDRCSLTPTDNTNVDAKYDLRVEGTHCAIIFRNAL